MKIKFLCGLYSVHTAVCWIRVSINSLLSSFLAVSRELKGIQTPHRLFWGIRVMKTLQPIGQEAEFKFESKFKPMQVIWHHSRRLFQTRKKIKVFGITPEGYSRRKSKFLTAKSMAKRLGQSCAGLTSKHRHRAFLSQMQLLLAPTGSLEENMLPLL